MYLMQVITRVFSLQLAGRNKSPWEPGSVDKLIVSALIRTYIFFFLPQCHRSIRLWFSDFHTLHVSVSAFYSVQRASFCLSLPTPYSPPTAFYFIISRILHYLSYRLRVPITFIIISFVTCLGGFLYVFCPHCF
jgi:hypothetical protein